MQSPTLGFIDDVEFFFPSDKPGIVEYRWVLPMFSSEQTAVPGIVPAMPCLLRVQPGIVEHQLGHAVPAILCGAPTPRLTILCLLDRTGACFLGATTPAVCSF